MTITTPAPLSAAEIQYIIENLEIQLAGIQECIEAHKAQLVAAERVLTPPQRKALALLAKDGAYLYAFTRTIKQGDGDDRWDTRDKNIGYVSRATLRWLYDEKMVEPVAVDTFYATIAQAGIDALTRDKQS